MEKCPRCGRLTIIVSGICLECIKENEEADKEIKALIQDGHTTHCANRQVFGDGECECHLYEKGYDPDAWMNTV
jgi:NMD protein affecting ribosome stability and mRNA decay